MIHDVSGEGSSERNRDRAMSLLVRRYWPAIYAFIRRSGRDVHEASDLTQGFITTVILQRGLAAKADQSRGRFRSLLLSSLRNYLRERHRFEQRRRPRLPKSAAAAAGSDGAGETAERRPSPFTGFDIDAAEGRAFESPDAAFNYQWSAAMVRSVIERVRRSCVADGIEPHWRIFEARVVRPLLFGEAAPSMADLVRTLDLHEPAQASNMLVTVKRRMVRALREEIAATVQDPEAVDDELLLLLRDLERGGKG